MGLKKLTLLASCAVVSMGIGIIQQAVAQAYLEEDHYKYADCYDNPFNGRTYCYEEFVIWRSVVTPSGLTSYHSKFIGHNTVVITATGELIREWYVDRKDALLLNAQGAQVAHTRMEWEQCMNGTRVIQSYDYHLVDNRVIRENEEWQTVSC